MGRIGPNTILITTIVVSILCLGCNSQCTWPTEFETTDWWDSRHGSLSFQSTSMTGISFVAGGTTINAWDCLDTSYFASEGILLMKSSQSFNILSDFYPYLCIKFTSVTANSYRYYLQHAQQINAGQFRMFGSLSSSQTDKNTICDAANAATGAEFAVLVKQGSETSAKITCPHALLGRFEFNYTDSSSTVHCNTASQHMDVCSDKTQISFPTSCSQSIVYADAEVYCVDSVTVGTDTFVQLYNPQSTVDDSTTYKMSCMVIASDSLTASVVYRNCSTNMTPTSAAVDHISTVIGALIVFHPYVFCQGGCNWPTAFASSTWLDNTRGSLVFTTTTMSGWSFTASDGSVISNWECLDNSLFDSAKTLVIKSTDTFVYLGNTFVTYICLKMTEVVADTSYYYYQDHGAQVNAANERSYIGTDATLNDASQICGSATIPASEFHFMVKSGSASSAKQYCPPSLLAKMDYTHTAADGTVSCDTSTDNWDVCTDRMVMTFDLTTCPTEVAFSTSGTVWCMANITSTDEYVVVWNTDASPTRQFACIASNSAGTSASIVYNNCTSGMTSSATPLLHDGTSIGNTLTMTATETCPFVGPTDGATASPSSSSSSSGFDIIPIIAGVVGLLVVAIIIGVVCYCYKKKKQAKVENEKEKLPDGDVVGNGGPMVMTDIESAPRPNPVFEVHPETRNTLTPLPPKEGVSDQPATSNQKLPPIKKNFSLKA